MLKKKHDATSLKERPTSSILSDISGSGIHNGASFAGVAFGVTNGLANIAQGFLASVANVVKETKKKIVENKIILLTIEQNWNLGMFQNLKRFKLTFGTEYVKIQFCTTKWLATG